VEASPIDISLPVPNGYFTQSRRPSEHDSIADAVSRSTSASPIAAASDEELARHLAGGDREVLALVYDRYAASLYRMLCALLSSPTDAEDALQEIFVKLAAGRIGRMRDLKSYLFGAARHEAFSVLRKRRRQNTWETDSTGCEAVTQSTESNYDWASLLTRLPVEQREVIALKVWEQMTFVEIAQIVRASPNTVMSRYRYGIERLRSWCREEDQNEL
jgi:RNA polymerase sigma-70 factor (ECF subfamily)